MSFRAHEEPPAAAEPTSAPTSPSGPLQRTARHGSASLAGRVAASAAAVLTLFMALTAYGLDRAFSDSARAARQELLLSQVYVLLAAADVDGRGQLSWPGGLPDARLESPGAGLYAAVVGADGQLIWQSPSTLTRVLPGLRPLPPGQSRFEHLNDSAGDPLFLQRLGIRWTSGGSSHPFTFVLAEDLRAYDAQLQAYRHSLWGWLGVTSALLLLAQAAVLRWGLQPLSRVADALKRLQSGQAARLDGPYPREIQGLADNLNRVLEHERRQQARHRDALADLAHSLKTPLALMRAELRDTAATSAMRTRLDEQVERMDRAVTYHLQRAASAGGAAMAPPHLLQRTVDRLIGALRKVHADKGVQVHLALTEGLQVVVDEGDLTELLGNVLDNAFKWSAARVAVSAQAHPPDTLILVVDDDGPGFDKAVGRRVLERGVRADERIPGHGIGLAVVRDIVENQGGRVTLARSPLGGARVELTLPGAALP